jgi:hypothetical protein
MKNSTKAALLSALVCPGLGQLKLRRYGRGIVFILVFLASLFIIVRDAVRQAFVILEKIDSSDMQVDIHSIMNVASQSMTTSETTLLRISSAALVVTWIVSIVDAVLSGGNDGGKKGSPDFNE